MRWLILFGTIFLAFTLIQGTAVEEYVEKDHDEYVLQEDLEGTLSRGADYGHPKIPGANTGYHPYPYKADKHPSPYPPQDHPVEYPDIFYSDEDKYQTNEQHYHDQQVSVKELKSILSHLLDDFLHKFKSHKCPKVHYSSEGSCDPKKWSKCTCVSPAAFTDDGRGNCNLGAIKADTQVWCYVDDKYGDPSKICPDSRKSNSKYGYYWSRYACIT